ncbi:hypothetical protein B0T11DRAFT_327066 [Plectosphaerella cucumerina]|uniref:Uncharacterized protein n=1 Tax=Plectosphaerella cucumerina TaxID=40658 RepID=A0A8K0TK16_9PEZI|nr:hypothetical protein B0T11DRAFT_327066 [Plectosphaerella cucumerina]
MALSVSHASLGRRHSSPVAAETLISGPGGEAGPEPTEAPTAPGELRKRQLADSESSRAGTCGYEYVGSSLSQSITCQSAGAECRTHPIYQARGCCDPRNCVVATTCMPLTASSALSSASVVDLSTLYCFDAESPACGVYQFSDDTDSNSMYFCAPSPTTSTIRYNLLAVSTSASDASTGSGSSTSDGSSTTSSASETTTAAAAAPASTPVGPIVGGVVGGVAGIALLSFLAWFFLIRRKNNGDVPEQAPPHMSQPMLAQQQYSGGPGQHPAEMGAPMYDNRGSIAKPQMEGQYTAVPTSSVSPGPQDNAAYYGQPPGQAGPPWNQPAPGQYYPQQGYEMPANNGPPGQHPQVAELPVTRPDGELRELQ